MLASDLTASSRYDLRDVNKTQWTDPELLDYLNRNLRVLETALASIRSDWSKSHSDVSVTSGLSYSALPSDFMTPRSLWDGQDEVYKETIDRIEEMQRRNESGVPTYYAVNKLELIYNKEPIESGSFRLEYNSKNEALLFGSDMPYNDEFNDVLREGLIIMAKNRNERLATPSLGLMEMYSNAGQARVISRNHVKKRYQVNF